MDAKLRGLRHAAVVGLVAVLGVVVSPVALSAPCADFTDVEDSHGFCANVEWIKNRSVTAGCTSATLFCPGNPVTRLQMAAFMNRLGTALTPLHLPVELSPGAIDLDLNLVVCQTPDLVVDDFPRRAYLDATVNARGPTDVSVGADVVMSSNAGVNWTALNGASNRGLVAANQWSSLADLGFADLVVGQTVRFGVRVSRGGGPPSADLSDSRCQLRVLVHSRNGSASPF